MKFLIKLLAIIGFGGLLTSSNKHELDEKAQSKLDAKAASKSQRKMKLERGHIAKEHIGSRRIMRNQDRAYKASNRYCNNIDSKTKQVIHN